MVERKWRAEEVERDPVTKKVLWVRVQYFKNGELLHDVRFFPTFKNGKPWVQIPDSERIVGDFIPWKRYSKMRNMAIAIVFDRKKKQPEQLDLPLKNPSL